MSFLGTNEMASNASSSDMYDSWRHGSSMLVKRLKGIGPSLPPYKQRRNSSLSLFGLPPISLSPNLSVKLTFSPLKKKVSLYLDRPNNSPSSSATDFSFSLACLRRIIVNLCSSDTMTLMLISTSRMKGSFSVLNSISSYVIAYYDFY